VPKGENAQQQLHLNRIAAERLAVLLGSKLPTVVENQQPRSRVKARVPSSTEGLTVVVTPNEVTEDHGSGILIYRLLKDVRPVAVVRTAQHYDGSCLFGGPDLVLPPGNLSREEAFRAALEWFAPGQIKRVLCVPFFDQELHISIALKQTYGVPLILYIMDDNCLLGGGISRQLMIEAIDVADLRLAISPEMQNAYQDAFRAKFWILPPLIDPTLICTRAELSSDLARQDRGIVIGNIWNQDYLERFHAIIRGSGLEVDWYPNTLSPGWLDIDVKRLLSAGIFVHDPLPVSELVSILRRRNFALVPVGTLDREDPRPSMGWYSLPSKIPFIAGAAATPLIVLGNEASAAATFVRHFRLGVTTDYSQPGLIAAVEQVSSPDFRNATRQGTERIIESFSAAGMSEWVFRAAETGSPPDQRFEELMNYRRKEFGYYVSPPAPKHIFFDFRRAYESLCRLKSWGLQPDFIIDVGSSTGIWSSTISELFPDARFLLIDPLLSQYEKEAVQAQVSRIRQFELLEVAIGDYQGQVEMEVSSNLYGSSYISLGTNADSGRRIQVHVATLDWIAEERKIAGRGILKIDVQYAEHLVIQGATNLLANAIDCVVVELSIVRPHPDVRSLMEMATKMEQLGFCWVDTAGEWRSMADGRLEQMDLVFLRKGFGALTASSSKQG
jgi:FkbM family methyltransferase